MDGILPIWKPAEITSYDVIRTFKHEVLKKMTSKVKVGHAGTLDPFAEGVLILLLGKATRQFDEIQTWPKTYRAVAKLGAYSDTLDRTGVITPSQFSPVTREQLLHVTKQFIGEIEQVVPQYSAAKYKGRALYTYARKGIETPEKKKMITIYSIEVVRVEGAQVELLITCSSGTYIRQLSYDIFKTLGIESYLAKLVREQVGAIGKEECLQLNQLTDVDKVTQRVMPVRDE